MGVPLLFFATPIAKAESGELAGLRREVEALKRTVEHLDARVESLERQLSGRSESSSQVPVTMPTAPQESPSAAAPAVAVRDRWRRITYGMTAEQVEALLGRPQRTVKVTSGTMWHYSHRDVGSGSVVFGPDGTVVDWQPPPFSTWWGF